MDDTLLIIQRVSDGCVLCGNGMSNPEDPDESLNNPQWFPFEHIPDGYEFFAIPTEQLYEDGLLTTRECEHMLLQLIAQYTSEYYLPEELRFLLYSSDVPNAFPMMLQ